MKRRSKWNQEITIIPCVLFICLNLVSPVFCSSIIWASKKDLDISRPKRLSTYREARRVENADLVKLSKVLRSVNEEEEPAVKSLETAFQSIEEESNIHESRKRSRVAKVLADLEDHTKKALSKKNSRKRSKIPRTGNMSKHQKGGRTVTINTGKGKKKVFIPKGFLFCTISPLQCYSSRNRKRAVAKRYIQSHVTKNKKRFLQSRTRKSPK